MEILDIYLNSQVHKVISLDKSRGMLSHAYLLECTDLFLLDNFDMLIAKEIFCLSQATPCGKCVNCLKVEHGNMVDLKVYPKDNKSIVVEDVNEIVSDSIQRPMDGVYKVYVLKNFDKATVQAQNKLLKTLEEPPLNVVFILTCSNLGNVLPTICSRVKRVTENLLSIEEVAGYLKDMKVKDYLSVASVSGGNISTALKLATGGDSEKIINLAFSTLLNLKKSSDVLKFSSQILSLKKDFPFFVDTLIAVLRDVSVVGKGKINFEDRIEDIRIISASLSSMACSEMLKVCNAIYNKLEFNCNLTGVVDKMLLDILEVKFLCQK